MMLAKQGSCIVRMLVPYDCVRYSACRSLDTEYLYIRRGSVRTVQGVSSSSPCPHLQGSFPWRCCRKCHPSNASSRFPVVSPGRALGWRCSCCPVSQWRGQSLPTSFINYERGQLQPAAGHSLFLAPKSGPAQFVPRWGAKPVSCGHQFSFGFPIIRLAGVWADQRPASLIFLDAGRAKRARGRINRRSRSESQWLPPVLTVALRGAGHVVPPRPFHEVVS